MAQSRSDANNSRGDERESEPLERGGRDGGKDEPLPAASQSVRPHTGLQNTSCDATRKNTAAAPSRHLQSNQRCTGTIWMSGAGRKEERYRPEVDPVVSGMILFQAAEVRDRSPLVTEDLQI